MVKEINVYVEGGGDDNKTWTPVRKGFSAFLKDLRELAGRKKIVFKIIPCGPRGTAKNDFFTALESNPDAFNILLVDSERPVEKEPWKHLRDQDRWELKEIHNDRCHLMVQIMESWLIADIKALKNYYGKKFIERKIPDNTKVEEINDTAVVVVDKEGERQVIEADSVVLAVGSKSESSLHDALAGMVPEVYMAGDCLYPGNIMSAIYLGGSVARMLDAKLPIQDW